MRGWLVENGFLKSAAFERLYHALFAAANRQQIFLERRTNDSFCPWSDVSVQDAPDFVLFWDKDVRLAALMEKRGLRCFNRAEAIRLCDDKTLTYLAMESIVPMPETILAPLTFADYGAAEFLDRVGERLGYPYIMKEGCGSFGQQVYWIKEREQAAQLLNSLGEKPVLFQRFVRESFGRDVRVYVVGEQCVAAMERVNDSGDFRANIAGGGHARAHLLTREEEQMALLTVKTLGLTFAGVDLLFSAQGPLLCEVNSNAHFSALSELTGVDPAQAIMREIKRQCAE